jgi:type II secretion system protein N
MTVNDEKRPRKWVLLLYGLYSLALVLFLLYLRFPSDAVKNYVESGFGNRMASMDVRIGFVEPVLPLGLVFKNFRLIDRDTPEKVLFSASDFNVRPEAGKIIRGIPGAKISCKAYGGNVSGRVGFSDSKLKGDMTLDVELNGINLEEHAVLQEALGRRIQGMLEGTVNFNGQPGNLPAGNGRIKLIAKEGHVEIDNVFLEIDTVEFSRVILAGDLMKGKFNLVTGDIEGPDYRGSLTGTASLVSGLMGSRLDLQGWIELFPSFFTQKGAPNRLNYIRQRLKRGKLNFSIKGTVAKPVVNLI